MWPLGGFQVEPNRRLNVAIADDDPAVRRTFELLIKAIGHTVICLAADGNELVRKCEEVAIDLALIDLHMPVMDGLEAAEILATHSIPVMLVSGHENTGEIVMENEPIVALIRMPASLDVIRSAIELAIGVDRP